MTRDPAYNVPGALRAGEVANDTAEALVRVAPASSSTAGACGHCGKALSRAGAKWCNDKCRKRAARGLPVETAKRTYAVPLVHGGYCVSPCPRCSYPEGDGGHCPECGWTATSPVYEAGSLHGPRYDRRGERIEDAREPCGTVSTTCTVVPLGAGKRRAA